MIDFGLSKRYKDEQGSVIPRREGRTGFRGSTAYASVFAHEELEQGTSFIPKFLTCITLVGMCLYDMSHTLTRLTFKKACSTSTQSLLQVDVPLKFLSYVSGASFDP